jgi:branched-subunit amino acid aminotransferase/4-amino-4-deoxychorismate lyase
LIMTIKGFRLTEREILPLDFTASTLDELTGRVSDGFYTTFSTLSGGTRVLGLRSHLERLYTPAKAMGLHPSVDEATLRRQVAELAKQNLPRESRIRLILTKDTGDVYIGIQPFSPLPESIFRDGVHVVSADMARHDPRIKGTDFIAESAAQRKLVKGDVFEVLLAHDGRILEGMTSNFYAVRHSVIARRVFFPTKQSHGQGGRLLRLSARNDVKLVTAQKGILLGVTRHAVLSIARGEGMSIEYRSPGLDEDFDEAFLTSSSRGVVPVVQIDGKPVGQGSVGEWTKRLITKYSEYVGRKSECILPDGK